jgi:hypothetical protein
MKKEKKRKGLYKKHGVNIMNSINAYGEMPRPYIGSVQLKSTSEDRYKNFDIEPNETNYNCFGTIETKPMSSKISNKHSARSFNSQNLSKDI